MARKADLVNKISKKIDYLSKEDISASIDLVFDYLRSELAQQNRIEIRGFGSFSIRDRKFPNSEKIYKTVYYRAPKNKDTVL